MTDITHFTEFDGESGEVTSGEVPLIPEGWSVVSAPAEGDMTIQELHSLDPQAAKAMVIFYGCNATTDQVRAVLKLETVDQVSVLMKKAKSALSEDAMRELQKARRDHVSA
ncbi:MAG: hypothetical protein O2904_02410 [bacterium]|nr:hypothetical protein [bacterium]